MLKMRWDSKQRCFITTVNNRILGEIIGKVYWTHRTPAGYFVKYNGFALSDEVINELRTLGIRWVTVDYAGKNGVIQYRAALLDFIAHGEPYTDNSFADMTNRLDHGDPQRVLDTKYMTVIKGHDKEEHKP